jgi:type I restriction enzyme M protein
LQHFIKILRAGGKAGIVIKNTFLSNTDNASIALRKHLLESCNLHTVLDLPGGVFTGAGVKTVVLFFEKGKPTRNVWYYQLNPGRNLGKTNPLNEADLAEFVELQKTFADSENSWSVDVSSFGTIATQVTDTEASKKSPKSQEKENPTYDLSVKNPNKKEETALRQPQAILEEMKAMDEESAEILNSILELL